MSAVETWDPDGTGPAQPLLVIAGGFTAVGNCIAHNVATFDPATGAMAQFGGGLPTAVGRLAVLANGDLVATQQGSSSLVRWNGVGWSPLGTASGDVRDLVALSNGDLVAVGAFTSIGGIAANRIARWNGSTWSSLGSGFPTLPFSAVFTVAEMANGDLVAASSALFGGYELARWNGTAWSTVATAATGSATTLATMPNGDLVAAGSFTAIGGVMANSIARWNGAIWSPIGAGINPVSGVSSLLVLPNGEILVSAYTAAGSTFASFATRWDGTSWSPLGTNVDGGISGWATFPNGEVFAGGSMFKAGTEVVQGIARWNGSAWSPLTPIAGTDQPVNCVATLPGGGVVVGGGFSVIGGVAANRIAIRNGGTFTPLGAGIDGGGVLTIAVAPNGDIIAGGSFTTAGGMPANNIARWDGSAWSQLGSGVNAAVKALTFAPNGDLVAGGYFTTAGGTTANAIARWNGSAWASYGPGLGNLVNAVAALPNGNIAACAGYTPMLWNGSGWTSLGSVSNYAPGSAEALLALPDGSLVLGGNFFSVGTTYARNVARWSGGAWSPLGPIVGWSDGSSVVALARLPDGDLVAGGSFATAGGAAASNIARWNGASWSAVDGGTSSINGLAWSTTGLVASGTVTAGTFVSVGVADLVSTCPASSRGFGNGCPGSGGANTLSASMPWVESTLVATGTGLPKTALIVALTSVTPIPQGAVPLASVFAEGLPGCDVLVAPDIFALLSTTTGTATLQTPLLVSPPLVGVTFYQQMVPLELDAIGNIVAITATNAVQLVAGRF